MPEVVTVVGIVLTRIPTPWTQAVGWALIVVGTVWGGEEAKRKQKDQEDAARRAYNDSLKDRNATVISAEAPHVYVYGRARVGSAVVAMMSSGDRDEYKHLVCVHAAHECDAIEEVYIGGKALGTLDGNGEVTSGDYFKTSSTEDSIDFSGTGVTLAHTPEVGSVRVMYRDPVGAGVPSLWYITTSYTMVGNVISGLTNKVNFYGWERYRVVYTWAQGTARVRVKKHLGIAGDTVDATTHAELGSLWPTTSTLSGFCYTIIRLDLNFADFQSGAPSVEVLLRGKKLHDVRSGSYPADTPVWSQNPALMIADYLTSEMCGVPWTDLPLADYIAAANVCDENITTPVNIGARYQANGTVTSDQSQPQVLEKMAQCMAGTIVSTTWGVRAGKYIAPVMALDQSDIIGDLNYTAGLPESDLYNGVKGQYISAENLYVATDFAPYQNAAYVTADGGELWTDNSFMFTDTKQRVHNLCRIFTEDQRNAFAIDAAFSYKCWALQVGDRITFTSTLMGQVSKIYRVTGKYYSANAAVQLTLKEDTAAIWDFLDAVSADATPNTNLPNPFTVPVPGNLQVAESLYETTGSAGVKVKAILTWDIPTDVGVQDYEVTYKNYYDGQYTNIYYSVNALLEILDINDGIFDFKVRARNHLNIYSAWSLVKTATIYGLTSNPSNVLNFTVKPFNGVAICSWDKTIDLDVKIGGYVEIRWCYLSTGATWEQAVVLPEGLLSGDASSAQVSLATGTYYIKFKDSTGHYSATAASFVATEALVTGWTTIATSTQDPTFSGTKVNTVLASPVLHLDSLTLVDSITDLVDSWGYIDTIGGIVSAGTYNFDAPLDLGSVASRRFHARIGSYSYIADDLMDSRLTLMDTWDSWDGATINGITALVYASTSNDNITYTNWVAFMVADFNCRYAKFKLEITNADPAANIDISQLSVAVKI